MNTDDRDIVCEQDYTPLSNAELLTQIEQYTAIMYTSPIIDFDLEWITGPARALLARAEAAEAEAAEARATNEALAELAASETERRVALAERVAELEAQLASADDETASASAQAARFWRTNNKLAERVAELEAALGELDALAPDYELPNGAAVAEAIASGYILTAGCRDIHGKVAGVAAVERDNEMLRARVAELEAQLAWRPGSELSLIHI